MNASDLGPLDWRTAIVDGNGRPTPSFQRQWNTQRNNNDLIGVTLGDGAPTSTPTQDGEQYADISGNPIVLYVSSDGTWVKVGVYTFTQLSDVPNTYTGSNNDLVQVNASGNGLIFKPLTLRLYGGFSGKPDAGLTLFEITMYGDEIFPVNLTGSRLGFDTANTNSVTLPIKVNGATVGNATIAAGGGSFSYTLASGYTATAGDKLSFIAPNPQDATLAGLTYTWLGKRSNT